MPMRTGSAAITDQLQPGRLGLGQNRVGSHINESPIETTALLARQHVRILRHELECSQVGGQAAEVLRVHRGALVAKVLRQALHDPVVPIADFALSESEARPGLALARGLQHVPNELDVYRLKPQLRAQLAEGLRNAIRRRRYRELQEEPQPFRGSVQSVVHRGLRAVEKRSDGLLAQSLEVEEVHPVGLERRKARQQPHDAALQPPHRCALLSARCPESLLHGDGALDEGRRLHRHLRHQPELLARSRTMAAVQDAELRSAPIWGCFYFASLDHQ